MLLLGAAMSIMSYGQTMEKSYYNHVSGADTCSVSVKQHTRFMDGRTIYTYVGGSLSIPPSNVNFGSSFEVGAWGTSKMTSYGATLDIMRHTDNPVKQQIWFGVKGYLTVWQNSNSMYFLYAAPKMSMYENTTYGLVEIGFNPCYAVNKHMLMSVTICDQIFQPTDNKFTNGIKNFGASVGLIIYR